MEDIVLLIIGVVCILIGISNRKGNLSLLHSYHRKRVSEEDRLPFGKLVGLGMIVIGAALILAGALTYIAGSLQADAWAVVSEVVLIAGLVIGLGISFYAMKKYNGGIF